MPIWAATAAVLGAVLLFVPGVPASAAPGDLTVAKGADETVLVGGTVDFTLTAANGASGPQQYNLTFRDVLPVGVHYTGPTRPAALGEPRVIADPLTGQETLIWANVSDLPPGASQRLTFTATPDPDVFRVGSTVSNTGEAYASTDARRIPRFDSTGHPPVTQPGYIESATSNATTTRITAVRIEKSEPSPEHELVRGVHDNTTVYTLKVTNNDKAATDALTVVDYLPAQLEFLGCGELDNSTAPEYVDAPSLTATPPPADCQAPDTVETVLLEPGNAQGLTPGVYTKVTWSIGTLAPQGIKRISYAAGIPQRANVLFPAETPIDGLQAANLDNNTGAPTREIGGASGEQGLTNLAQVGGTYTGTDHDDNTDVAVDDEDRLTVTSEDIALHKSVTTETSGGDDNDQKFAAGGLATYTLTVRTGEYADASDIVLTDVLPDGLCPLDDAVNHASGSPAECAPGAQFAPVGATLANVTHDPGTGTYTLVFDPIDVPHSDEVTITYFARMRASYVKQGDPTVSGDSYTNQVSLTGTTTTRPDVDAPEGPGNVATDVRDDSHATITSDQPELDKLMAPREEDATACETRGDYDSTPDPGIAANTFHEGDRICFRVRVVFSADNSTKNPVLRDLLPDNVEYVDAVVTAGSVDHGQSGLPEDMVWQLGTPHGSDRFVSQEGFFEVTIEGRVIGSAAGPTPDLTGNLAKLAWTDTDGSVGFARDQVDFSIAAPPPVSLTKAATRISPAPGVLVEGALVTGGDLLEYTVTVRNDGTVANRNAQDVVGPDVWDVLPAGVTCALITTPIPDGGECYDPGVIGQPDYAGKASLSAIRWDRPDTVRIAPGDTLELTYRLTVPTDPRVVTTYLNTAAVASYGTESNVGTVVPHHPADNVDQGVDPDDEDVPAATDDFNVKTSNVALAKSHTTGVDESHNAGVGEATIGEEVTYTVLLTVPAHATVHNGTLTDVLPAGLVLIGATDPPTAEYDADASSSGPWTALPGGVSLNTTTGALSLGTTYVNTTGVAQQFRVVLPARVATTGAVHGDLKTNTATFVSTQTTDPGSPKAGDVTAQSTLTVVEPSPSLTKSDGTGHSAVAGEVVTYTLVAGNAADRPPLHDAYVVDCVPAGLTFDSFVSPPAGAAVTSEPGSGANGCSAGTTRLRWEIGSVAGGATDTLIYRVKVTDAAAGGESYVNTATVTGSSLDDDATTTTAIEGEYSATATNTLSVEGAGLTKSTSTPSRTIGQRAEFTVTVALPAEINFYNATVYDELPAGLDAGSLELTGTTCTPSCSVTATPLAAAGQKVGWSLGDLAPAVAVRTVTLTYTALVGDVPGNVAGTPLTNGAWFGWDTVDGPENTSAEDTSDQSTTTGTAVVGVVEPSLGIVKDVSTGAPAPGETFTYTVAIDNDGGVSRSPAYDVTVTDTIPAGVVVQTGTISNGGVLTGAGADGGGTITWTLAGPVNPGATVGLTYAARLATPAPPGVLTNTARITGYSSLAGDEPDERTYPGVEDTADVQAALPHVVVGKAILDGSTAYIGEAKTWQITVTSDSGTAAYGVDVEDVLPPNWTYVTGTAQVSVRGGAPATAEPTVGSSGNVQTLTWTDLGDLPLRDDTIVVTFDAVPGTGVVTSPGVGRSVDHVNTASTTAEDSNGEQRDKDGNPYNGGPDTAVAHVDKADVRIAKVPDGSPVAGRPFAWKVTVTNDGPDTATGVFTVTDTLPAGLDGPFAATGTGWNCGVSVRTITCVRTSPADTLASGASFPVITVTGQVPAGTVDGTQLTNDAEVTSRTYDPDPDDNETDSTVTVSTQADLRVVKGLSGGMTAGEVATYTFDVTNLGPSVHTGTITVADAIPGGTTFVSVDAGAGWTCTSPAVGATGTIECSRPTGTTPVGPLPQIVVKVEVDSGRTTAVTNTATVDGPGTDDPTPGNNPSTVTETPATSADLGIQKTSLGSGWVAGGQGVYEFTVINHGPSDAKSVRFTDQLNSSLAFVSASSIEGDWDCPVAGQAVTCALDGDLAAGDTAVVRITVDIDAGHTGSLHNEATVTSDTDDPIPGNNTTEDDTDSNVAADLGIVKSHTTSPVVAGRTITYQLTVTNHGLSNSAGPITVTDVLPVGMTCRTVHGVTCAGRNITVSHAGGLAVGDHFDIEVIADIDPGAGPATLVNRAVVIPPPGQEDPDPTNNSAEDPATVTDDANIVVTKSTTGDNPVRAGAETEFTISVHNEGPSDADSVSVTDTLPAGMGLVSIEGNGWTCVPSALTCTRPVLAAGATATITVRVVVGSAVADGTTLTNVAVGGTSTPGDDPGDNTGEAPVDVVTRADLEITKSHTGASPVVAGTDTTYTLSVKNNGPSDARKQITITDTLPADFGYLAASAPWACTAVGQAVTCVLDEDLVAGATAPLLTMTVHVAADANVTAAAKNVASVSSPTTDPVPSNDESEVDVPVARATNLSIAKSHAGNPRIGTDVTFTLAVHNDGPSTARDVAVVDTLPAGLTFVSASGAGWTCGFADPEISCSLGDPLAADDDADPITVVATVEVAAYPSVTNSAEVSTTTPETDLSDNTADDEVTVPAMTDLSVVKKHTGDFKVGTNGAFTLTVHNAGPTEVPGTVTVTDTLPAGLGYVSASGSGWTCAASGQQVTCSRSGLAADSTSEIVMTVAVLPGAYPSVSNTAVVDSDSEDTDPDNNVSTDVVTVHPLVDLVIDKSVVAQNDDRVTWRLTVTNQGPNDTVDPVVVTDVLPRGLAFVSAKGKGWVCTNAGRSVTCTRSAPIAAGASSAITLVTEVTAAAGTRIRNVAEVEGGSVVSPSTDSDSATVRTPVDVGLPSTGGPPLWLLPAGLLMLLLGGLTLWRHRRGGAADAG